MSEDPAPYEPSSQLDGYLTIAMEIGGTMNGLASATALTRAAAAAGVDAIKVQILDVDRLVGLDRPVQWQTALGAPRTASMRDLLRRRHLQREEWAGLKNEADNLGLGFIATIDGKETLRLAVDLGVDALKLCSGDVTNLAWVEEVAMAGSTIMLDTGHATLGEIEHAVDAAWRAPAITIHHSPSGYPARIESMNLRVITTLRQMFPEHAIAFSDHYPGWDMDLLAIALGVSMIEKTLTLDRLADGPEHAMSVDPEGAKRMVDSLRAATLALGAPRRVLTDEERASRATARRSAFAMSDHKAGDRAVVEWRRPASGGIEPGEWPAYAYRRLTRDVGAGEQIQRADFGEIAR